MKEKFLIMLAITFFIGVVNSQTMYEWTPGSDPGWTASNNTNYHLSWQNGIGAVSTNNANVGYAHNQNSTYTSSPLDTRCPMASMVNIKMRLNIYLEPNYDFLYFEYSNNGGTWITVDTYNGYSLNITRVYDIISSDNTRFRFRFMSDGSRNGWNVGNGWFNFYYADILDFKVECITYLPIELTDFSATKFGNSVKVEWETATETDNDHFKIERSNNGFVWTDLSKIEGAGNSTRPTEYCIIDTEPNQGINYYRLTQVDFDGSRETFPPKSIVFEGKKLIRVTNMLGQAVPIGTKGVLILIYNNGEQEKIVN